jgi:uncharacterized membrane protein
MMRTLFNVFLTGLLAVLPVFLTIYCTYYFASWLNGVSNRAMQWFAPDLPNVPGLGIVIAVLAIFVIGVLVSSRLTRWIYKLIESPLRNFPVVKDLYSALKQLTVLLTPQDKSAEGKVVRVKHPGLAVHMVGLMMRSDVRGLDTVIAADDMVAVYFPMSYQIGGYTAFVPRDWVTVVDMPVEEAMRNALTGWMKDDSDRSVVPER